MSEHDTMATPATPPASLRRMVLYGTLFALLIMLLGMLARERREAAVAKPFPAADGRYIIIAPGD